MKAIERTARTEHQCVTCGQKITKGDRYMSYTAFPADALYFNDQPVRFAECWDCITTRAAKRATS